MNERLGSEDGRKTVRRNVLCICQAHRIVAGMFGIVHVVRPALRKDISLFNANFTASFESVLLSLQLRRPREVQFTAREFCLTPVVRSFHIIGRVKKGVFQLAMHALVLRATRPRRWRQQSRMKQSKVPAASRLPLNLKCLHASLIAARAISS